MHTFTRTVKGQNMFDRVNLLVRAAKVLGIGLHRVELTGEWLTEDKNETPVPGYKITAKQFKLRAGAFDMSGGPVTLTCAVEGVDTKMKPTGESVMLLVFTEGADR